MFALWAGAWYGPGRSVPHRCSLITLEMMLCPLRAIIEQGDIKLKLLLKLKLKSRLKLLLTFELRLELQLRYDEKFKLTLSDCS
jgi:hypothetical protein